MSPPIIIYRLGSLGDTVIALPCFRKIAERYPDRRRLVLTNVPVAANAAALQLVLGSTGLIHGVIDYPVGVRSARRLLQLRKQIRATGADTLIYMSAPRGWAGIARDVVFFRLCGLRRIIGAPLRGDWRRHRRDDGPSTVEPEAERIARTLHQVGPIDLADRANWDLALTPDEIAAGRRALAPVAGRPVLAINMGGKVARNDWGEANWRELVSQAAAFLAGYALVAVGAECDAERAASVLAHWPGPTANLCGRLTPRETAAALQAASLFVGHDSGPMHLAAAVGVPTLGIFGDNTTPRVWHPYGPGARAIHDLRGIHMVSVDQVVAAVRELALGRRPAAAFAEASTRRQ